MTNATGTLVFMMGVAKIGYISEQLIRHGRPADTPVALVRWGTRAEQDTLVGTLQDIAAKVAAANFKPPAVIVVGEVVNQREHLQWAERLPLFGKRILVTRARSQASELVDRIDELGGEPYEYPVIETVMPSTESARQQIAQAFSQLSRYDWVFFTSVNGVDYFFRHLEEQGQDIRSLHRARLVAVGPATLAALRSRGLTAVALPEKFHAEGMLESLDSQLEAGQCVLLPRGDLARSWLPDTLREMQLEVTEIDTYETVMVGEDDIELRKLFEEKAIHAVTFTSSSTVTNLLAAMRQMGFENPADTLKHSVIACIGPQTALTAEQAGLHVGLLAEQSTLDGLIDILCRWNAGSVSLQSQ